MINTNTLLILGAGASRPYGLPLGGELRDLLYAWDRDEVPEDVAKLLEECGVTTAETKQFARQFIRSRMPSIDAFLEIRTELVEIGKLLLAYEIGTRERPEVFQAGIHDDWYAYLWRQMTAGTDNPQQIPNNKLRTLTFNYDRSLEYCLYQAVKATYDTSDADALRLSNGRPVLHLYGMVGRFHYLGGRETRTYSPLLLPADLRTAADAILVIPEAREHPQFETARKWIDWADDIAIMGFGFDQTNCKRLDVPSVLQWCLERQQRRKRIMASTFMMTPAEVAAAKAAICPDQDWTTFNLTNLEFLRHTDLLR